MSKHFWLIFCLFLIVGGTGCKNQQKLAAAEEARVKAEKTAQANTILNSILNDDGQMTLAEKEGKLRQAKALNSGDPEVQRLITQVEEMLDREREALRSVQERPKPDPELEDVLSDLFGDIANADNSTVANNLIEEGLAMFSSPEVPVLIIINDSGNQKDYDAPTTVERYLHYLKDQQASPNKVYALVKDGNGKISELELIKKSKR